MHSAFLVTFWLAVALLAVSLVADGAAMWIAHRRRSRFRARWAGPAPASGGSLSERLAVREQNVRDIAERAAQRAHPAFVRADQRRAR